MNRGQQLEKNLTNIMRSFFTPSYWPNRSGLQNGYDAYANFKIKGKEYFWKFECKDLNSIKHRRDYADVLEMELSDFSDKILEVMAMADSYYPHVYCVFIPHKKYRSNTILLERLTNLNIINKFPFKIVIWDFDFLKEKIPYLNIPDANTIYPNAPDQNKARHAEIVSDIINEVERESVDGYLHNRSFIREREAKHSLLVEDVLHIKVKEIPSDSINPLRFEFEASSRKFTFNDSEVTPLLLNVYPYINTSGQNGVIRANINTDVQEISTPTVTEEKIFDQDGYAKFVDEKKTALISLFKKPTTGDESLFNIIKAFCSSHPQGIVSFICPSRHLLLASLPIKELISSDFESGNGIHFYLEFK